LISVGATDVVPEMVEGSLRLGGSLLHILGKPPDEVSELLEEFRRQTYSRLVQVSAKPPGLNQPEEAQRRLG
jgi:voltage-gated potassium channel Kch